MTDRRILNSEEVASAAHHLADVLVESGSVNSAEWYAAVSQTPRHAFVPQFYWADPDTGRVQPMAEGDPRWLGLAYSDQPLVTQFDGTSAANEGTPTSSSTAPSLMLRMLEALDVHDGHRALEIGTGTGYNAALLAHRLGGANVTTIDVDPVLTALAAQRLAEVGIHVHVVTGDGVDGHDAGGPYDRIIATCAVRRIPPAWLAQLAPGGLVMATVETSFHGYGLALVGADGQGTGVGKFLPVDASFMPMRSDVAPPFTELRAAAAPSHNGARPTAIRFGDLQSNAARFSLGLTMPDVATFGITTAQGPGLYIGHLEDRSWAELHPNGTVSHGGDQDLWAEVEAGHRAWVAAQRPEPDRYNLEIAPDGATIVTVQEP